jgi:hypothetical protein
MGGDQRAEPKRCSEDSFLDEEVEGRILLGVAEGHRFGEGADLLLVGGGCNCTPPFLEGGSSIFILSRGVVSVVAVGPPRIFFQMASIP